MAEPTRDEYKFKLTEQTARFLKERSKKLLEFI